MVLVTIWCSATLGVAFIAHGIEDSKWSEAIIRLRLINDLCDLLDASGNDT